MIKVENDTVTVEGDLERLAMEVSVTFRAIMEVVEEKGNDVEGARNLLTAISLQNIYFSQKNKKEEIPKKLEEMKQSIKNYLTTTEQIYNQMDDDTTIEEAVDKLNDKIDKLEEFEKLLDEFSSKLDDLTKGDDEDESSND